MIGYYDKMKKPAVTITPVSSTLSPYARSRFNGQGSHKCAFTEALSSV